MDNAFYKVCTACGLDKSALEYYRDKRAPHGLCTQCRQCMNDRKKAKRQQNLDEARQKWREDYANNKERYSRNARAFIDRHSDRVRIWRKNNHHKRRDRASKLSSKEFAAWFNSQVKVCHWCGIDCEGNPHIDHVVPFCRGGKHEIKNMVISCPSCNFRKSRKGPDEWIKQLTK